MTLEELIDTLESANMLRIFKGDEEIFVGYLALFAPEVGHTNCKLYAQERAGRLYMILRDCTPVIADLNMHNMQVITESTVVRYIPASNKMDGMRCDIAAGFGELGKVIAHGNVRDDLNDERKLAKYIVDNETISENENIECRR